MDNNMNERPDFSEIRVWLQEHLSSPNNLILSNNTIDRIVIINGIKGPVPFQIPQKTADNINEFKNAWINVYLGCLDYLNKKVNALFTKEDLKVEGNNTILLGNQRFVFTKGMSHVEYINKLEEIVKLYEKMETEKQKESVKFTVQSVEIDNPIQMSQTQIAEKTPNIDLNTARMEVNPIKQPAEIDGEFVLQKLNDDELFTIDECPELKKEKLLFVTCTNLNKGENVFRDNNELFQENIPNVKRAAFIAGRTIREEHITKESVKIIKLCAETLNTNIIMYEVNNEAIQSMCGDSEALEEAISSIAHVLDILYKEGYKVLVCLDSETKQTIDSNLGYTFNYPTFLRILPRELDSISKNANLVVMDPQYDNDQIIVKNPNIIEYLGFIEQPVVEDYEYAGEHLARVA